METESEILALLNYMLSEKGNIEQSFEESLVHLASQHSFAVHYRDTLLDICYFILIANPAAEVGAINSTRAIGLCIDLISAVIIDVNAFQLLVAEYQDMLYYCMAQLPYNGVSLDDSKLITSTLRLLTQLVKLRQTHQDPSHLANELIIPWELILPDLMRLLDHSNRRSHFGLPVYEYLEAWARVCGGMMYLLYCVYIYEEVSALRVLTGVVDDNDDNDNGCGRGCAGWGHCEGYSCSGNGNNNNSSTYEGSSYVQANENSLGHGFGRLRDNILLPVLLSALAVTPQDYGFDKSTECCLVSILNQPNPAHQVIHDNDGKDDGNSTGLAWAMKLLVAILTYSRRYEYARSGEYNFTENAMNTMNSDAFNHSNEYKGMGEENIGIDNSAVVASSDGPQGHLAREVVLDHLTQQEQEQEQVQEQEHEHEQEQEQEHEQEQEQVFELTCGGGASEAVGEVVEMETAMTRQNRSALIKPRSSTLPPPKSPPPATLLVAVSTYCNYDDTCNTVAFSKTEYDEDITKAKVVEAKGKAELRSNATDEREEEVELCGATLQQDQQNENYCRYPRTLEVSSLPVQDAKHQQPQENVAAVGVIPVFVTANDHGVNAVISTLLSLYGLYARQEVRETRVVVGRSGPVVVEVATGTQQIGHQLVLSWKEETTLLLSLYRCIQLASSATDCICTAVTVFATVVGEAQCCRAVLSICTRLVELAVHCIHGRSRSPTLPLMSGSDRARDPDLEGTVQAHVALFTAVCCVLDSLLPVLGDSLRAYGAVCITYREAIKDQLAQSRAVLRECLSLVHNAADVSNWIDSLVTDALSNKRRTADYVSRTATSTCDNNSNNSNHHHHPHPHVHPQPRDVDLIISHNCDDVYIRQLGTNCLVFLHWCKYIRPLQQQLL